MMFVVRRLQEMGRGGRIPLFLCFIDLQKAYDSVDRALLWKVLQRIGVPPRMLTIIRQFHEGMRACVRSNSGNCSEWFEVGQGLRQGCVLSPLLFNIFFAAVLTVILQRFASNELILSNLVHLEETRPRMGPEPALAHVRRAVWGMLYADDAGVVSRSPKGLAEMMHVVVKVCGAFGLTVSEKKTETMCMPPPRTSTATVEVEAAGQRYRQTDSFVYLGGTVTEAPGVSAEIRRRIRACWANIKKYSTQLYDRPTAAITLKTRMAKAEAIEALLYGSVTWTLRQDDYNQLRTTHHRILLRILGEARSVRADHRTRSYASALQRTACESIERTIRKRRLLFAGALTRMSVERLPKHCLLSGRLEGAEKRGPGGREKVWLTEVERDVKAFSITGDWQQ